MTEQSSKASLYRKIAEVAAQVPIVKPTGYNPDVKKPYADVDDIAGALKPLLEERQLSITMHVNQVRREATGEETKNGNRYMLTTLECSFVIADGETGETAIFPWAAEASDHMKDKGLPKALTIARRTFLLHTFHVIAGDEKQLWSGEQGASYGAQRAVELTRRPTAGTVGSIQKEYETSSRLPVSAKEAPVNPQSQGDWASMLKAAWMEEQERGGFVPANELAIDLDNPEEATIDRIKALGKLSKARLIELRKKDKELQPASDYTRATLIDHLKNKWREEGQLGGIIPAADVAYDLDNEEETPHELIWTLGKRAAARVKELKASQELQPA